tara:strand:- start:5880 stop:6065 length:186 start_codon:yes stop_codon:yes gene_type:complete
MSKNLDRYWQLEYQLQLLWEMPRDVRDHKHIQKLTNEQKTIISNLQDDERRQFEDSALTHH